MMSDSGLMLEGTASRALSSLVRFALSARTLGPARVTCKLARRLQSSLSAPDQASYSLVDLAALRRCTWIDTLQGVQVCDWNISRAELARFQHEYEYPRYYYHGARRVRYSLWHYVGTTLCELDPQSTVVDVGAQAGLWGTMIRKHVGCRVYDLDLEYRPGIHGFRIGSAARAIPLADQTVTHMVCFCAFNCFVGADDSALIQEAARLLRPGGRLVIVPLCIGDQYVNLYDPRLFTSIGGLDPGATPAAQPGWGNSFGRWYDRCAFERRILEPAGGCRIEVFRIHHDVDPADDFEALYAIRLTR